MKLLLTALLLSALSPGRLTLHYDRPGGGGTPENARRIVQLTGCTQIHASASVLQPDGRKVTSEGIVKDILAAIGA